MNTLETFLYRNILEIERYMLELQNEAPVWEYSQTYDKVKRERSGLIKKYRKLYGPFHDSILE